MKAWILLNYLYLSHDGASRARWSVWTVLYVGQPRYKYTTTPQPMLGTGSVATRLLKDNGLVVLALVPVCPWSGHGPRLPHWR
jgi:hypothetical protein